MRGAQTTYENVVISPLVPRNFTTESSATLSLTINPSTLSQLFPAPLQPTKSHPQQIFSLVTFACNQLTTDRSFGTVLALLASAILPRRIADIIQSKLSPEVTHAVTYIPTKVVKSSPSNIGPVYEPTAVSTHCSLCFLAAMAIVACGALKYVRKARQDIDASNGQVSQFGHIFTFALLCLSYKLMPLLLLPVTSLCLIWTLKDEVGEDLPAASIYDDTLNDRDSFHNQARFHFKRNGNFWKSRHDQILLIYRVMRAKTDGLMKRLTDERSQNQHLDMRVRFLNDRLKVSGKQIKRGLKGIARMRQQLKHSEASKRVLKTETSLLDTQVDDLKAKLKSSEASNHTIQIQNSFLLEEVGNMRKRFRDSESSNQALQNEVFLLDNQVDDAKKQLKASENSKIVLQNQLARLNERVDHITTQLDEAEQLQTVAKAKKTSYVDVGTSPCLEEKPSRILNIDRGTDVQVDLAPKFNVADASTSLIPQPPEIKMQREEAKGETSLEDDRVQREQEYEESTHLNSLSLGSAPFEKSHVPKFLPTVSGPAVETNGSAHAAPEADEFIHAIDTKVTIMNVIDRQDVGDHATAATATGFDGGNSHEDEQAISKRRRHRGGRKHKHQKILQAVKNAPEFQPGSNSHHTSTQLRQIEKSPEDLATAPTSMRTSTVSPLPSVSQQLNPASPDRQKFSPPSSERSSPTLEIILDRPQGFDPTDMMRSKYSSPAFAAVAEQKVNELRLLTPHLAATLKKTNAIPRPSKQNPEKKGTFDPTSLMQSKYASPPPGYGSSKNSGRVKFEAEVDQKASPNPSSLLLPKLAPSSPAVVASNPAALPETEKVKKEVKGFDPTSMMQSKYAF